MRVSDRALRWLGVALLTCALLASAATVALSIARGDSLRQVAPVTLTDLLVQGVPFTVIPIVGAFIVWRVPRNWVGWILLGAGVFFFLEQFTTEYTYLALLRQPGVWPPGELAAWLSVWLWVPGQATAPLILLLFPDGHAASPRWRWIVRAVIVFMVFHCAAWAISPLPESAHPPYQNPVGQPFMASVDPVLIATVEPFTIAAALLGVVSIALRYRRGDPDTRHQLKWFLYAAVLLPLGFIAGLFQSNTFGPQQATPIAVVNTVLQAAGQVAIPAAIAIAIFKYRLYDIDVFISRTLVYGSLAVMITGVYVGIAVGIGELVGSGGKPNLGLSILATAIVAVGFQPAREGLQRIANHLVYGKRATPYQVLSEFSSQVAGSYAVDAVLPQMARVLQEGAGVETATVWVRSGRELRPAATHPGSAADPQPLPMNGSVPPIENATRVVEVRHQGELLGALSVVKRRGESLTPVEEKLLDDLAHQAGLVLKNVGLTADLQRRLEELRASRQRLVSAQDAERRRLERNLHDGAQQHLVALKVKLGLAEMLAAKDREKARATISQLKLDADEALETLRDLARGIYPPLLAEKGLVTALESQARKATVPVTIDAEGIGRYPEEIEATVYFCVLEALQNVQKYAEASHVAVHLEETDGRLHFEVRDDGHGFDVNTVKKGAGLTNMTDRLDAVDGEVTVTSEAGGGTSVAATIRLPAAISAAGSGTIDGDAAPTAPRASAPLEPALGHRRMPA